VADWDNDGDVDLTTREVFRTNLMMETGEARFVVSPHTIPGEHIHSATPSWADWDLDGDLDAAIGNYFDEGHFYENGLHGPETPEEERRFLRVVPFREGPARGTPNEFGAIAEVRVEGDPPGLRRRKHTASSHGYLNQNQYPLHFGLPADPSPGAPGLDLRLDLSVDFPGVAEDGLLRVDGRVNPALNDLPLAVLEGREVRVSRSGTVEFNGCRLAPKDAQVDPLTITAGGLVLPTVGELLAEPEPVTGNHTWYGLEVDTLEAAGPEFVAELVVDGQLDSPVACADANVFLWDVTGAPQLLRTWSFETDPANNRSTFPLEQVVPAGRVLRLVALLATSRETPAQLPVQEGGLRVRGGLELKIPDPCAATAVSGGAASSGGVRLALRHRPAPESPWVEFEGGLGGDLGVPRLQGLGMLEGGALSGLAVTEARPDSAVTLLIGSSPVCETVLGLQIVPGGELVLEGLSTDADGNWALVVPWPVGVPPGETTWAQVVVVDPSAPGGFALSNPLASTTP
jgi:hypothetical protein